jgi:hypothetical protein
MRERFQSLEGVQGLRGILALARETGQTVYASDMLDSSLCSRVSAALSISSAALPTGVSHVTINYLGGRVLIYFIREHLLILHVDQRFDVNELRSRIRDAAQRFKEKTVRSAGLLAALEQVPVTSAHMVPMQKVLDTLAAPARDELGVFVTVKALTQTRESLLKSHPVLATFLVGKDGSFALHADTNTSAAAVSRGVAAWTREFFRKCNDIIPTFPPELALSLLEPLHGELEKSGFFEAWAETRGAGGEDEI